MWYPGYQSYYNENVSQRIPLALGRTFNDRLVETGKHTGIEKGIYYSVVTPDILVRPRLQQQVVHPAQYDRNIVTLGGDLTNG